MRCGNCGSAVPDAAAFCPECGADARAAESGDGDRRVEAPEVGERRAADVDAAAGGGTAEDGFEWGLSGDGRGAEGPAGDDGPEGDPDAAGFEEPTRLSRPAGSSHPDPVMGTEGDVVGRRVGAFLVDRFVLAALVVGPVVAAVVLEPLVGESAASVVAFLGGLAAVVGILVYTLLLEGIYGQTLGKRVFGVVVVKEDGAPCTVGASVLRSLLWVVDRYFLGLLALALVLATERSQRFGDMVAHTVVVRTA